MRGNYMKNKTYGEWIYDVNGNPLCSECGNTIGLTNNEIERITF